MHGQHHAFGRIRTREDPLTIVPAVCTAVLSIDPELALQCVTHRSTDTWIGDATDCFHRSYLNLLFGTAGCAYGHDDMHEKGITPLIGVVKNA